MRATAPLTAYEQPQTGHDGDGDEEGREWQPPQMQTPAVAAATTAGRRLTTTAGGAALQFEFIAAGENRRDDFSVD